MIKKCNSCKEYRDALDFVAHNFCVCCRIDTSIEIKGIIRVIKQEVERSEGRPFEYTCR